MKLNKVRFHQNVQEMKGEPVQKIPPHIPSPSPSLTYPSTLQTQRILPRLLLAPQWFPQAIPLRILLVVHVACAHARNLAVRASKANHPAHHRIHHVTHRTRDRFEAFAHGRTDGTQGRVDARAGAVAVAAEEGI